MIIRKKILLYICNELKLNTSTKMNKKVIKSTIIGIMLSGGLFAQTQSFPTTVKDSLDKHKVVTNHFFDNWFFGAGIGGQVYFGEYDSQQSLSKRISPSFNLYIGKWFSPGIGIRLSYNGNQAKGITNDPSNFYSTGETFKSNLYRQKIKYTHLNGDVLFNLSNLLAGYKEDRFYNIIPYIGAGWIMSKKDVAREDELTAVGGILNTFRLSNSLNLTLDIKGVLTNDRFDHESNYNQGEDKILSASIGLIYKFKKRNWDRGCDINENSTYYNNEELNGLRERIDALAKANEDLRQQLADASNKPKSQTIVDKSVLAPPLLITFPINQTTLSKEARVNLGYFAKIVKDKPGITYIITGYADKGTGTSEVNQALSRGRAQVVYDALIREFGVNPAQLKTNYEGGVDNMFYNDPRLSRSVVAFEIK
jgi:outer membrane protein OmpA-like peptidoglycan-associated protein